MSMRLRGLIRRASNGPFSEKRVAKHLRSYEVIDQEPKSDLKALMERLGESRSIEVERYTVDIASFERFCNEESYEERFPQYFKEFGDPTVWPRKLLEHFISFDIIQPKEGGVYVDVASSNSPVSDILRSRFGAAKAYKQDLRYPPGVHGTTIGSNADAIPLPDSSVDALISHNSWEHFEGESDAGFLRESARLLRPGGTLCIIPLNIAQYGYQITSPEVWHKKGVGTEPPQFDRRLPVVVRDSLQQRLIKMHSPDTLEEDIRGCAGLRFQIHHIAERPQFGFQRFFLTAHRIP